MSEEMITSEEAIKLYTEVGLSENTFYRHAREKKIRKSLPDERQRGAFYHKSDITKILEYQRKKRSKRVEIIRAIKEEKGKTDWFNDHDLPYLLTLDYETYGVSESLDLSISHGWWTKNSHVCRILYNRENRKDIWGYVTMIPMEDETIFKLLRREIHERNITPADIQTYENGIIYHLYAASVVMKPEYTSHLRTLIQSIFNYWCDHYPAMRVSKIYAYAESAEGWYLIKHLFFSPRYDIGEKAFELDLDQPNPSKLIAAFQDCLKERQNITHDPS